MNGAGKGGEKESIPANFKEVFKFNEKKKVDNITGRKLAQEELRPGITT